ncbi:MAG TPA: hypothetical protein O0X39_01320 [Methanocorpusculum sp.]|nr:hypothetical protein [Methanocorpusculum sp.]
MSKTTIIHCEEIAVDSVIVTLGPVQVDISRISAYNTIRFFKMIEDITRCEAKPEEASKLILDIAAEQGGTITEEDILKAGNQKQVEEFVQTIAQYVIKTYAPLQDTIRPFLNPAQTAPE